MSTATTATVVPWMAAIRPRGARTRRPKMVPCAMTEIRAPRTRPAQPASAPARVSSAVRLNPVSSGSNAWQASASACGRRMAPSVSVRTGACLALHVRPGSASAELSWSATTETPVAWTPASPARASASTSSRRPTGRPATTATRAPRATRAWEDSAQATSCLATTTTRVPPMPVPCRQTTLR